MGADKIHIMSTSAEVDVGIKNRVTAQCKDCM